MNVEPLKFFNDRYIDSLYINLLVKKMVSLEHISGSTLLTLTA